ncbi:MAG TPA: acyl-CoA dehydrogenase family protein [Solirubrobacteraceae bacterium]|nr:acyl-CoA dehydrogenase family protein [Solirubrobacteraceae bacterium]
MTRSEVRRRAAALAGPLRERAAAAERAGRLAPESVAAMLDAGLARILVPERFGGYELGLGAWIDAVIEIAAADASHGWCASLLIHHPHYLAQFPLGAQEAVWADGPDVALATSLEPRCEAIADGDGYRLSGRSPFTSGILHSSWVLLGGMLPGAPPEPALFLVEAASCTVEETWATTAMRATGSNTVVSESVPVASERVLRIADLREGRTPGGQIHHGAIYSAPWMSYTPLTFATPLIGCGRRAIEELAPRLRERGGQPPAGPLALGRAHADLDAAELLIRRAAAAAEGDEPPSLELRARTMRDASRASELALAAIDAAVALSGSSGFAAGSALERAWRDAHFAASHVALNPSNNFAHWGRTALGLERPGSQVMY